MVFAESGLQPHDPLAQTFVINEAKDGYVTKVDFILMKQEQDLSLFNLLIQKMID